MSIQPLLNASTAVQIHVATVVPAFVLGTWLLFGSAKGSPRHRLIGTIYLTLMAITAIAATAIRAFSSAAITIGPLKLGLLHLFVPLTAWSIWRALHHAKRGEIAGHRGAMRGLYFGGLIVAGLLAFMPGRVMYRMFFG